MHHGETCHSGQCPGCALARGLKLESGLGLRPPAPSQETIPFRVKRGFEHIPRNGARFLAAHGMTGHFQNEETLPTPFIISRHERCQPTRDYVLFFQAIRRRGRRTSPLGCPNMGRLVPCSDSVLTSALDSRRQFRKNPFFAERCGNTVENIGPS